MITSFEQAREVLARAVPSTKQVKYSLDNIRALMNALNNPQNTYPVIHVAGTSGKTSTAYYAAALLQQTGKKVGLTVSPHIDEINERVQINLVPLPEQQYCRELSEFLGIINKLSINPSYFEILVAFAFWEFAQQKVDYAVIEVGLGGLLDGTNVIDRADKACVITDIGFDHEAILGNELAQIAAQKAGIIHAKNDVFCYAQDTEVITVLQQRADEVGARLHVVDPVHLLESVKLPLFQQRNWGLAKRVVDYIGERDHLPPLTSQQLAASTAVLVPARMETIRLADKTLILDGSHNGQKMQRLVEAFQQQYPNQKAAVVLSLVKDKIGHAEEVLALLQPITSQLIITEFAGQQDQPKVSMMAADVAVLAKQQGITCQIITQPEDAYKALLTQPEQLLMVTGPFYLLNHIRPLVFKNRSVA